MEHYIHPTYLGRRTVAHNSSFGCPFACSFCAVVAMTNRRWLAQIAGAHGARRAASRRATTGVDAVQMHDMDFFISEARVAEFAERIAPLGITWWALGRIDTLMQYSDATWRAMARSGLKMVFSGAESSSDAVLATMNKGGKASARAGDRAGRRGCASYGVVPEYLVRARLAARSAGRPGADLRVHPHDQAGESGDRDRALHLHAGADGRHAVRGGVAPRLRVSRRRSTSGRRTSGGS